MEHVTNIRHLFRHRAKKIPTITWESINYTIFSRRGRDYLVASLLVIPKRWTCRTNELRRCAPSHFSFFRSGEQACLASKRKMLPCGSNSFVLRRGRDSNHLCYELLINKLQVANS